MGVQKVEDDYMTNGEIGNDVGLIEHHDHSDSIPIPPKSPKSRKQYTPKSPRPQTFMKEKGYKHARRYENTRFLLDMVDYEEFGEVNIHDFMGSSQTVFGELLTDEESMEIWNDFINHPEEEQEIFLRNLEGRREDVPKERDDEKTDSEEGAVMDKRSEHPAFTPEECFKRISPKLKALLHRRHLPKGTLEMLEDELMSWFTMNPDSMYVAVLPSSYDRLLLHAVSQYLDLHSMSADYEGTRHTEVVNNRKEFLPPDVKLSEYLERFS